MTTTDPTAIQNATGPNLIWRPAWVIVYPALAPAGAAPFRVRGGTLRSATGKCCRD
jgi:hypothetical protein